MQNQTQVHPKSFPVGATSGRDDLVAAIDRSYGSAYRTLNALWSDLAEVRDEVWFDEVRWNDDDETIDLVRIGRGFGGKRGTVVGRAGMSDRHADARLWIGDPAEA